MKKDEIIELLKEQLRVANDTVSSLTTQVNELIERIKSLEELLVQKGIAIDKANLTRLPDGQFHDYCYSGYFVFIPRNSP